MAWFPLRRHEYSVSAPATPTFETAILPHLDSAYNIARWLVGDTTLAEDVVQDAMVRALRYFESFRGGDSRAWLLRIVRNAAHEARTLRQRHEAASLNHFDLEEGDVSGALDVEDPSDNPEATLGRQEDRLKLRRALAALPIDLRECLILRELEELSYKEIAHVTGVPVGTVMSRLWRARRSLVEVKAEEGAC
jgi:RNA polymerase sigma-70 factor (ECF subfamily)